MIDPPCHAVLQTVPDCRSTTHSSVLAGSLHEEASMTALLLGLKSHVFHPQHAACRQCQTRLQRL